MEVPNLVESQRECALEVDAEEKSAPPFISRFRGLWIENHGCAMMALQETEEDGGGEGEEGFRICSE